MIYPRLKVARDLLTDDGVIFISIDDNEVENLKKVCDEVFGSSNLVSQFCWRRRKTQANLAKFVSQVHEYIVVYSKNINSLEFSRIPYTKEYIDKAFSNKDNDPKGLYQTGPLARPANSNNKEYTLTMPNGRQITAKWSCSQATFDKYVEEGRLFIPRDGEGMPRIKIYLSELPGMIPNTWLDNIASNDDAARMIADLFGSMAYFDYSKPIELLQFILNLGASKDAIILDFFSGSATTAHAVMKLNAEDGGNRKFIMVQLPEKTDEKSEAYKAGYKNICEIGKERIRRAGRKINEELGVRNEKLDIGFRVLKLDSSNMEDVYYTPKEFSMSSLFNENVKSDRTNEDLLFQVMLDLGIELSVSIRNEELGIRNDITVFNVDDGYLMAVFDKDVDEKTITEIAKRKPVYFVMRDASASNDNVIDNFEQIFKHYSPETTCRII
jgi:adenine-specific DNA-methyltransferase